MASYSIKEDGICITCNSEVNEKHVVECYKCKVNYHGFCGNSGTFCTKTFLNLFKGLQNNTGFLFICPYCVTEDENTAASDVKQQLAEVVKALAKLKTEVEELKNVQQITQPSQPPTVPVAENNAWNDEERKKKVKEKVTLCIKSAGETVDMSKVKKVITTNGIQVTKTSISKKNGDVYIDLPSNENREKLVPLLREAVTIPDDQIVNIKQKCPTVSISNVQDYVDQAEFIDSIKKQNSNICEKIDAGLEFSVVFSRKQKPQKDNTETNSDPGYLVVIRVANEIRDLLKANNDRIYYGTTVHRVIDRFYIKSCAKCHKFGHYHAECTSTAICGYCMDESHTSEHCQIRKDNELSKFKCINCKEAKKTFEGHSSHYKKCPTYLDVQKRTRSNIPYYNTKN